jgi:hypothetical protein
MQLIIDRDIKEILQERLNKLEEHFKGDVIFYQGDMSPYIVKPFRDFIEELKEDNKQDRLFFIVKTHGGNVEIVEKIVKIVRHHYHEVNFVVPDFAMSAGTILCMSGDSIHMDYSSSLGPIDPQVFNGKKWVPALGYLDKVNELIKKSVKSGGLSEAEYLFIKGLDLAELSSYEQAKDLSISLLKEWLVKYKFKNWNIHSSSGKKVSHSEKVSRANKIAKLLSDNKLWHSHGRSICIKTLTDRDKLNLKIDSFDDVPGRRDLIRNYNDMICDYFTMRNIDTFFHSRKYLF